MKKKKILIPLICLVVVVLSLVAFLIVASNYKKTYVLNKTDYRLSICPTEGYYTNEKTYYYYRDKGKELAQGKNVSVKQDITLWVIDKISGTPQKILTCTQTKYTKGDKNIERNAYIQVYGYNGYEIPTNGYYKFVEYPLWKSKNILYVTYYFED